MTDPLDIAHVVLVQLAEQVRKLPPELITQLYEGTARIEIVPKGGRSTTKRAATATTSKVDIEQIRTDLAKINDRASATRYVADLNLTVTQLVALADALGIPSKRRPKLDEARNQIVQWTVGRRIDSDAISQPGPSRF